MAISDDIHDDGRSAELARELQEFIDRLAQHAEETGDVLSAPIEHLEPAEQADAPVPPSRAFPHPGPFGNGRGGHEPGQHGMGTGFVAGQGARSRGG